MGTDDDETKIPRAKAFSTLCELKPLMRWPGGVGAALGGLPAASLKKMRSDGNHPRLFAIGRALFTTAEALLEWVHAHELAPGEKIRPAMIALGSKLPSDAVQRRLRGRKPKPVPAAPSAPAPSALPGLPKKSKVPAKPRAVEAAEQAA